jgi:hypothetical protein
MSYSRYNQQEHIRERYEDYMDQKRKMEQEEKYEEDYAGYHTGGGVPLYKLVHVTNINYLGGGFAAVNWNAETKQFLICEPGQDDWAIDRTEENLRAFAHILAFDPKMWGCHRCGCSAEFKDQERVCGCDACQTDGCCSPAMIEAPEHAPPRAKSQYFMKRRGSLPPPPIVPLKRQSAVGSSDTFFEPASMSPNSASPTNPFILSAEDNLRFKSS